LWLKADVLLLYYVDVGIMRRRTDLIPLMPILIYSIVSCFIFAVDYSQFFMTKGNGTTDPYMLPSLEKQDIFKSLVYRSGSRNSNTSLLYETLPTNVDVEFHSCWTKRKVYICPRGVGVHRGHPQACEKASRKFLGDADILYEEESVFRGLMVKKEVVFDTGAFMERPAL
jgi:hypothetical protein